MLTATANDIITEALEILGVLGEGETPTTDQMSSSLRTLNMLVKTWQADGLHLFAVQNQYLFPQTGVGNYTMSSTTTDLFTDSYTASVTTVAGSTNDVSITIENGGELDAGNFIGISNGTTIDWYQVTEQNIPNTIGVNPYLIRDYPVDTKVYYYNNKITKKPLKLLEAYNISEDGESSYLINIVSRRELGELSNVKASGKINQIYFDPQKSQANLSVWPLPQNPFSAIKLVVQRSLDETAASNQYVDYPEEWLLPLAYNLAKMLSAKYGIPVQDYQRIAMHARELYDIARGFDSENETSVFFKPDYRW